LQLFQEQLNFPTEPVARGKSPRPLDMWNLHADEDRTAYIDVSSKSFRIPDSAHYGEQWTTIEDWLSLATVEAREHGYIIDHAHASIHIGSEASRAAMTPPHMPKIATSWRKHEHLYRAGYRLGDPSPRARTVVTIL
jgi:hypothetical protein